METLKEALKAADGNMYGTDGYPHRAWTMKQYAVIVSAGKHNRCILFTGGPALPHYIDLYDGELGDIGLQDPPKGIWIWEGYHVASDSDGEWREEVYRAPLVTEWAAILQNKSPWDPEDWHYNAAADRKAAYLGEDGKKAPPVPPTLFAYCTSNYIVDFAPPSLMPTGVLTLGACFDVDPEPWRIKVLLAAESIQYGRSHKVPGATGLYSQDSVAIRNFAIAIAKISPNPNTEPPQPHPDVVAK